MQLHIEIVVIDIQGLCGLYEAFHRVRVSGFVTIYPKEITVPELMQ